MNSKLWILPVLAAGLIAFTAVDSSSAQQTRRSGRMQRSRGQDKAPKVGDKAPNFKLKSLDGKSETELASFKGKKPVVLFFGSYT